MAVTLIVQTILLLGLISAPGIYSEDAPKCETETCENGDVFSSLQSRVHESLESRAEELACTFVGMMEADTSIGEKDSTDDGLMWGECQDDSGVTHYLFDDDELENFGPGDKIKVTVSEVSGSDLPTAPSLPWQSDNVHLYKIESVIAHESALLTDEDHSLTDGATTPKEIDVLMMICNYQDLNAFVTDENKVMNSFYQKLGEKLYSQAGQGSFADMINASSWGRLVAPRSKGKVVTVRINKNFPRSGCPYSDMARDCKQAVRDQTTFDPDDFTYREFFIPTAGGCQWGGLASVGCGHYSRIPRRAACHAWYRSDAPFVRAHEIGHNLGFSHAGGDWGRGGSYVEYGDPQAAMGASYRFSSFTAAARYQGGFLHKVAGEAVEFQPDVNVGGNSATFKLQSISKPLGEQGADAVGVFWNCPRCVPKVSSHRSNVGGNLWLQFRGDEGYSNSKLSSNFQNKVYVHLLRRYSHTYYGRGTEMWKMMGKGDSYTPPNSETTVTVQDIVGDLATVTLQVAARTTTTAPPTMAPTPLRWHVVSGSCTVDASGCAMSVNFPGNYPDNDRCSIMVDRAGQIRVQSFNTERGFDKLRINSRDYSGTAVGSLQGVVPQQGSSVTWASDRSVVRGGWKLCPQVPLTNVSNPPVTTAAPPPVTTAAPPPVTTAAPPPVTTAAPPPVTTAAPPPVTTTAAPGPSPVAVSKASLESALGTLAGDDVFLNAMIAALRATAAAPAR